jgi:hypothetical protein
LSNNGETHNWPDLAIALYDKLTGRGAEIIYTFENMEVHVPSGTSADAAKAAWKLNGTVRVQTRDKA